MLPGPEFEPFEKIARLNRNIIITEKIDGTNAQIYIPPEDPGLIYFGSRKRWVTTADDNFGFAKWGVENREELLKLGPGRHYGEWWGVGIQRGYAQTEKRFSLFNVSRWRSAFNIRAGYEGHEDPPECCGVVPVLYFGPYGDNHVENCLRKLEEYGSVAVWPAAFMDPEGVVVYHAAARNYFKVTIKNDEKPKGSNEVS